VGCGRYVRGTSVLRGDRTLRPRGTHVLSHESRVHLRVGASGHEAARTGESDRENPAGAAPATCRRANPQVSRRPARAGTAPREGKALEGSSRDASGMEQGREASGATAIGGVQKTSSEPRAAGTVERGKNPEDGTDEGLAILVPRGRPRGRSRRRRGTRRSCVRGSKNLTRGGPARSWNGTAPS
jgi:hypothetical protein